MVRVHTDTPKVNPTLGAVEFDPESTEYYPSSCCEVLHVRNAVLASTVLQVSFILKVLNHLYIKINPIVDLFLHSPWISLFLSRQQWISKSCGCL